MVVVLVVVLLLLLLLVVVLLLLVVVVVVVQARERRGWDKSERWAVRRENVSHNILWRGRSPHSM